MKAGVEEIKKRAEEASEKVSALEKEVRRLRKESCNNETKRRHASIIFKNDRTTYQALKLARESVRKTNAKLIPKETKLREAKRDTYYLNKVLKSASSSDSKEKSEAAGESGSATSSGKTERKIIEEPRKTSVTWSRFKVERATHNLDIQQLITNARGRKRLICFAGTDYGLVTMSETCPQVTFCSIYGNALL